MNLKQALQANLDSISPGVTVDSASVEWFLVKPHHTDDISEDGSTNLPLYIGIICAALTMVGIASFFVWKFKVSMVHTNVNSVEARTIEVAPAKEMPQDFGNAKGLDE